MTAIFPFVETAPRDHKHFSPKVILYINYLYLIVFTVNFKNVKEGSRSKVLRFSVYVPCAGYSDRVFA